MANHKGSAAPTEGRAWQGWLARRAGGLAALLVGLVLLTSPLFLGEWAIALLGGLLVVLGVLEGMHTLAGPHRRDVWAYVPGVVTVLAGMLVWVSPSLVLSGLLTLLALLLAAEGVSLITGAVRREQGPARWWTLLGGVVNLGLAALVWFQRSELGIAAVGVILGIYVTSEGWRMLLAPLDGAAEADGCLPADAHPDPKLGLAPDPAIGRVRAAAEAQAGLREPVDAYWVLTIVAIFFAIHLGRMQIGSTWLGLMAPVVAVVGDLFMALVLAWLVVIPARLLWRVATRPVERAAWHRRLDPDRPAGRLPWAEYALTTWLDARLAFDLRLRAARASLRSALQSAMQVGLPITAVLVAINPIWGFSWFFNTENWASGFWQKVTEGRTDTWREAMIAAVDTQLAPQPGAAGSPFAVHPPGLGDRQDFTFLVIGDTGEGDASQASLRDRYLEVGRRPDVRFLVVSSDVIYPAGEMKDYELNFYLPFKGFEKPIYAIPGNHDWFNALDGFVANFFEPDAARVAMRARVAADYGLSSTDTEATEALIARGAFLREQYGVRTGLQRGPFFELHGARFSLLAVDTGILRQIDARQDAWLRAALARARGNFTMVILGHPFFAGGERQDTAPGFAAIHALLREAAVPVVMAGDTHDFEYYAEPYDAAGGKRVMQHFVNGGGGAYLSIGTSLAWPAWPAVADWAFYPRTDAVEAKLRAETPLWKWPFLVWLNRFDGWPLSVETLSGAFDFNRAPFFQSFMEVRVEGSRNQVRFVLHGVNGPLRWRDLQIGGEVVPAGQGPDDPAEWAMPMPASRAYATR